MAPPRGTRKLESVCAELGLQILVPKRLHEVEWVDAFTYRGVTLDKRLMMH